MSTSKISAKRLTGLSHGKKLMLDAGFKVEHNGRWYQRNAGNVIEDITQLIELSRNKRTSSSHNRPRAPAHSGRCRPAG